MRKEIARAPLDRETQEQLQALGYVAGSSTNTKKQYSVEDDPKKLVVFHNRVDQALGFYNRGNDLKALEILEKVISEKPDYSTAYFHVSFIQSELGFPDKAVGTMQSLLRRGNNTPDVLGKIGLYLYQSGKFEQSIQQLRLALKSDSRDLDNLNYLGMAYTETGQYKEAEDIFNKAAAIDPSDGMTLNNLGTLYLRQGKVVLAAQKFEAALALNPHIANAYNGLGVAYAQRKKVGSCHQELESRRSGRSAGNYDALLNLAYAYLEVRAKREGPSIISNI